MNKEMLKEGLNKLNNVLKTAGKVTIVIVAMGVGFMSGEIYRNYQNHIKMTNMQESKKTDATSVAINERGELMIIDRTKGTYTVYENQIGTMIFNLYANKIYTSQTQK